MTSPSCLILSVNCDVATGASCCPGAVIQANGSNAANPPQELLQLAVEGITPVDALGLLLDCTETFYCSSKGFF